LQTILTPLLGLGAHDFALLVLRLVLGVFFLLARFRWMFDPSRVPHVNNPARHTHLAQKLCQCGYHWHPYMSAFVAITEISSGILLILGLLTVPAAFALLVILCFATYCTAYDKVMEQNPVDKIDMVSCYLWRVEGIYIALAISIMLLGPGAYSLDALIVGALR